MIHKFLLFYFQKNKKLIIKNKIYSINTRCWAASMSTAIPRWTNRVSSAPRSQTASGPVSTWMGDRLGIRDAVGMYFYLNLLVRFWILRDFDMNEKNRRLSAVTTGAGALWPAWDHDRRQSEKFSYERKFDGGRPWQRALMHFGPSGTTIAVNPNFFLNIHFFVLCDENIIKNRARTCLI